MTMNPSLTRLLSICFLIVALIFAQSAFAKLVDVRVENRAEFTFDNKQFEALQGQFSFEFDPSHPENQKVVDLDRAPRNEQGQVEAVSDFFLIQPKAESDRKGMLIEISNRGSKASLRYFNQAPRSGLPTTVESMGDGLIQRLGLSMLWVGWQPDVKLAPENMNVVLPNVAVDGLVRSDWTLDVDQTRLSVAHREQIDVIYHADLSKQTDAYLTVRQGRNALKTIVPKNQWRFSEQGDAILGKFGPGIYELVYPAKEGLVIGLGQALIRDTAEYVKTQDSPYFVPKTLAFGVSQTGRWLRHFLYQGFNKTESGKIAFDGMLIHTAGAGRGSFNHRYAQPSRDAHRMSAFFYPTDLFPFTSQSVPHPLTGQPQGLLSHLSNDYLPKLYVTNTGYEYWGRAAGLIHTYEGNDVAPHPNERIFHLASGQHFVESQQGLKPILDHNGHDQSYYQGNPLNFLVSLRALLSSLTQWVVDPQASPLENHIPSFKQGSLINVADYELPEFLSGLKKPASPHTAFLLDYGPRWSQGIVDNVPPRILAEFVPPVPAVDQYGNEIGGVRHPLLDAPLATFLPWVVRDASFANDEMQDFRGSLKLMSKSVALSTYKTWDGYLTALQPFIKHSISNKTLLAEDEVKVKAQAKWLWEQVMAQSQ